MTSLCPLAQRALFSPNAIAIESQDQVITWRQLDQITEQLIADLLTTKDPMIQKNQKTILKETLAVNPSFSTDQKSRKDPQTEQWIAVHQCDPLVTLLLVCMAIRTGVSLFLASDRDPEFQSKALIDQLPVIHTFRNIQSLSDLFNGKDPFLDNRSGSAVKKKKLGIFSDQMNRLDQPKSRNWDHPRIYLQTSGSTQTPKIVAHSLKTLMASATASNANIPFQTADRWLLSLALWHIGGLAIFFRALCDGGTVCIPVQKNTLAQNVIHQQVTHLSVVALQLTRMMSEQHSFPLLKHVLVGGGPIPKTVIETAQAHHIPVHTTYGMTELGSQLCTTGCDPTDFELTTAGRPLNGWAIKVDSSGEICAKGSPLFLGYYSQTGLTPARDSQGWFHTGDIGEIHNDGSLKVLGRKDSQFISGGENIYPEEIEKVLTDFPTIKLATVVPIPSTTYGQRPFAFVLGEYSASELKDHLLKRLPKFKHPDRIAPWPPQVPTHKPSRSALRALALHYNPPTAQKP
ncbi:MAG: AMP-binding protein [Myxococcota bacterium]|nr:AMP-binding protein [Myxococcota bacterium]